jgi:hypothetical protein
MNLPTKALAIALLAAIPGFAASAGAAPFVAPGSLQDAGGAVVETVAWRGGGFGRGWGGGWHGGHGWWGPAAGLAAGAIIGGAVAASQPWYGYDYGYDYGPGYAYDYSPGYSGYGYAPGYSGYGSVPGNAAAYCAQRYRSYDPASGTFLGFDGLRHPCP